MKIPRLIFLGIVILLSATQSKAQNLVSNPSFETETACPGISSLPSFQNWRDPWVNLVGDTCSTSDSYRVGGGFLCGGNFVLGATTARTGTRVAGIITYSGFAFAGCAPAFTDNWREYAEGQLTSPLTAGQTYCVSLWVKLASNVKWATNRMGVYFSNGLVSYSCNTTGADSHLQSKGIIPQLESATVITNTASWTNLTWSYVATGGENYITIGNFRNVAGTTRADANCASFNTYAYYYLDDVSVTPGACALPIMLTSFDVKCEKDKKIFNWITATETNNDFFTIEESADGMVFDQVATINGAGNSNSTQNYSFILDRDNTDIFYYRLKQTDFDGEISYSEIISTVCSAGRESSVIHPNPANDNINITVSVRSESEITITLMDALGKIVFEKESRVSEKLNNVNLDIKELKPAVYFLKIVDSKMESSPEIFKIIKQE